MVLIVVLFECFAAYDKSGDGIIDKEELPEALRFAGINPTNTDLDTIIRLFDTNGMIPKSDSTESQSFMRDMHDGNSQTTIYSTWRDIC